MAQYSFGSGSLWGIPVSAAPTPAQFAVLQDVSVDFNFSLKELRGQFQFPVAVARGGGKITWKAKAAKINGAMLNSIFFNGTNATGLQTSQVNEAGTVAAATITVSNSATFLTDLGVTDSSGVQYTRVASGPVGTQYAVAAGVYTFNATQNAQVLALSYVYSTAGTGNTTTLTNQLMGNQTTFKMILGETFAVGGVNKQMVLTLNAAVANKLTIATKLEDFTIPEWDGEAFADSAGNIGTLALSE